MKRNIKKASVKFRKNLVYADFCLYPKSVIITTLRYGIEKIFFNIQFYLGLKIFPRKTIAATCYENRDCKIILVWHFSRISNGK